MKKIIVLLLLTGINQAINAQNILMTRSGQISFFSKTPMENIEAVNNEVNSMLNPQTGELVFAVLVKSFRFERALMEEHFNENYMESGKFPKSTFQGKITNLETVDFKKNGSYPVTVEGDLTMHGVKQHVTTNAMITIAEGKITATASLSLLLKDYNIERPSLVAEKIAERIEIKINCKYEPKA